MLKRPDVSLIEKIKSILIVVLTLSTILLLYFFWSGFSPDYWSIMDREEGYETIRAQELVQPTRMILSQGEDSYGIIPQNQWPAFQEAIAEFVDTDALVLEEITGDQYQAVMSLPSARACFDYDLSLSALASVSGFKPSSIFGGVDKVSEIGYGAVSKESLLLKDEKKNKYYRIITTEEPLRLPDYLNRQKLQKSPAYFQLGTYLGGKISNDTLIPVFLETDLGNFSINREVLNQNKGELYSVAQAYFGKTFDFVRKIEEGNGTIIYMYGYGQKTLIIQKNGILEYKEEPVDGGRETGYVESLQAALNYISGHGAFESISGSPYTPYLKGVEEKFEGKKGYLFTFGVEINGTPLYGQEDQGMTVEVRGGQVVYFKRDLGAYDVEEASSYREPREAYSALNIIAENYDYFIGEMGMTGTFEELASEIQWVEPCYVVVRDMDDVGGAARAAWRVHFTVGEAFFDLYTAEPIGFRREKEE